jgi:hypothetical protein
MQQQQAAGPALAGIRGPAAQPCIAAGGLKLDKRCRAAPFCYPNNCTTSRPRSNLVYHPPPG